MCSIIGSFDKKKLIELIELNSYRGQHSHSISYYGNQNISVQCDLGPIDISKIDIPFNHYCIVHLQAPTTENTSKEFVHPASINGAYLWHNGILKLATIEKLQRKYNSKNSWDSYLLLQHVLVEFTPDDVDGSFACLLYDHGMLFLFRNEIAPLFFDTCLNISSTKFYNSYPIKPNKMFLFDPHKYQLQILTAFTTVDNPYFMKAN